MVRKRRVRGTEKEFRWHASHQSHHGTAPSVLHGLTHRLGFTRNLTIRVCSGGYTAIDNDFMHILLNLKTYQLIMNQAIKNIIPRILQYSKRLDKVEVFVDRSWVFIDEVYNNHEYIFLRDYRLLMSVNGKVITGKWEILPTQKILIDRISDQVLLEHHFIDDSLLILKISGTDDNPFILIDKKKIPDLDVLRYLQTKEEESNLSSLPDKMIIILNSGEVKFKTLEIGSEVVKSSGDIASGLFEFEDKGQLTSIDVLNGRLVAITYTYTYRYNKNKYLTLKQNKEIPSKGDIIENILDTAIKFNKLTNIYPKNDKYQSYMIKCNLNGELTYVISGSIGYIVSFYLIVIFIAITGIISLFMYMTNA